MEGLHGVEVSDAGDPLLEEVPGHVLGQGARPADEFEEVAGGGEFHGDSEVGRREEGAAEEDDVGVAEGAVVDDLAGDVLIDLFAARDELDGEQLVGGLVAHEAGDAAAVAWSEGPDRLVVLNGVHWFWRKKRRGLAANLWETGALHFSQ